jgi:hypothetical protein
MMRGTLASCDRKVEALTATVTASLPRAVLRSGRATMPDTDA